MNLNHDFVQVRKLSEDQIKNSLPKVEPFFPQIQVKTKKKRSSPKVEHFFPPNSSGHLRSDAHQSQIIGGGWRCRPYTQTIGVDTVKLLGGYIPPFPSGFGTPGYRARRDRLLEKGLT